jgi:hypothetical protein
MDITSIRKRYVKHCNDVSRRNECLDIVHQAEVDVETLHYNIINIR